MIGLCFIKEKKSIFISLKKVLIKVLCNFVNLVIAIPILLESKALPLLGISLPKPLYLPNSCPTL